MDKVLSNFSVLLDPLYLTYSLYVGSYSLNLKKKKKVLFSDIISPRISVHLYD